MAVVTAANETRFVIAQCWVLGVLDPYLLLATRDLSYNKPQSLRCCSVAVFQLVIYLIFKHYHLIKEMVSNIHKRLRSL